MFSSRVERGSSESARSSGSAPTAAHNDSATRSMDSPERQTPLGDPVVPEV